MVVSPHALVRSAARPTASSRRWLARAQTSLVQRARIWVMGIETSADDTCVALLNMPSGKDSTAPRLAYERRISCANRIYGGIYPVEATGSHMRSLPGLIQECMLQLPNEPSMGKPAIDLVKSDETESPQIVPRKTQQISRRRVIRPDLIAVTRGPGMGSCLDVGVSAAKALSVAWSVPVVGVHHMLAHALTPSMEAALDPKQPGTRPVYPFLSLLVSGKHTMLVYTKSIADHRIVVPLQEGIALGDLLDKCARDLVPKDRVPHEDSVVYPKLMEEMLAGTTYREDYSAPATRAVAIANRRYDSKHGWQLSMPHTKSLKLTYEFSGLLGAVHKIAVAQPDMDLSSRQELAFQTMRAAFEHVADRIILALQSDEELLAKPPRALVLSGGVASSKFLRQVIGSVLAARGFGGVRVRIAEPRFCTDNAAMIAYTGGLMYNEGWRSDHTFNIDPKWQLTQMHETDSLRLLRKSPPAVDSDATKSENGQPAEQKAQAPSQDEKATDAEVVGTKSPATPSTTPENPPPPPSAPLWQRTRNFLYSFGLWPSKPKQQQHRPAEQPSTARPSHWSEQQQHRTPRSGQHELGLPQRPSQRQHRPSMIDSGAEAASSSSSSSSSSKKPAPPARGGGGRTPVTVQVRKTVGNKGRPPPPQEAKGGGTLTSNRIDKMLTAIRTRLAKKYERERGKKGGET